jgi:hypothetical protein
MGFQPNGAIWVNDNHAGVATLYDGLGAIQTLVVTVPPPIGNDAQATPTGMVANAFKSNAPGNNFDGDIFIFATEDGTISGWQGSLGKEAAIRRDNSEDGSIYKGLAQGVTRDGWPQSTRPTSTTAQLMCLTRPTCRSRLVGSSKIHFFRRVTRRSGSLTSTANFMFPTPSKTMARKMT